MSVTAETAKVGIPGLATRSHPSTWLMRVPAHLAIELFPESYTSPLLFLHATWERLTFERAIARPRPKLHVVTQAIVGTLSYLTELSQYSVVGIYYWTSAECWPKEFN